MAAVWIDEPTEVELSQEEVHRKGVELAEQLKPVVGEIWPELFEALTDEGKALFIVEILKAQRDANGDIDAMTRVAEAWWRTMLARADYAKNISSIGEGRVYSPADLKAALKLPEH